MVNEILGGSTPKYGITIKDENGVVIDPATEPTFNECLIELYNKSTKATLVKYAYPAKVDYITATVENSQVVFVLGADVTGVEANQGVEYGVIVTVDLDGSTPPYPSGHNVSVKRGTLVKVKTPKG